VRKAISLVIPHEQIVKEIVNGYGQVGAVPIPFSAAEYNHDMLKPIPYDFVLAKQYMEKAGYKYEHRERITLALGRLSSGGFFLCATVSTFKGSAFRVAIRGTDRPAGQPVNRAVKRR
jgi:ABC-type transport system substrate-binding protein